MRHGAIPVGLFGPDIQGKTVEAGFPARGTRYRGLFSFSFSADRESVQAHALRSGSPDSHKGFTILVCRLFPDVGPVKFQRRDCANFLCVVCGTAGRAMVGREEIRFRILFFDRFGKDGKEKKGKGVFRSIARGNVAVVTASAVLWNRGRIAFQSQDKVVGFMESAQGRGLGRERFCIAFCFWKEDRSSGRLPDVFVSLCKTLCAWTIEYALFRIYRERVVAAFKDRILAVSLWIRTFSVRNGGLFQFRFGFEEKMFYICPPVKGSDGRAVRQRSAKPRTAVRFRFRPQF